MLSAYYWLTAATVAVVAIWFIWGRKFTAKQYEGNAPGRTERE